MQIKILKSKKFCIPMEAIKETKKGADIEEKLIERIENMTDEEYEIYVEEELAEADLQIKNGQYVSYEEVMKELKEYINLLEKEEENYKNWKKILANKRGESKLRHIL